MAETRPFGIGDFLLLVLVLALAGAARAGYLISYADNAQTEGPLLVQDPSPVLRDLPSGATLRGKSRPTELDALIHNLKEHNWFGSLAPFATAEEQTAHVAPGYPWMIAQLARVLDPGVLDSSVRWIQCGLGALTAGLYFLFARRAFASTTVATLAGLFCAIYPFWIINTANIADGVLSSFLLAVSLCLGVRAVQTNGPFASLLFGLSLAGLTLVRAAFLPFAFIGLAWFLLRSRQESRGWLCALLAFLGFANGLVPWTVRNYQVFQEPVPVVTSVHFHLWIGNNPKATGGAASDAMMALAPEAELREIKEQPRRYGRLGQLAWDEVSSQPLKTLQRRVQAWLYFFFSERFFQDTFLAEAVSPDRPIQPLDMQILCPSLVAMLFLALLGWRWTYGWRKDALLSVLALIWVPVPYIFSHAESLHGPRLPLDGVLLCYAAFALACFLPGIRGPLLDARQPEPRET